MNETVNTICRQAVDLLVLYGIRDVVLCPGNRNAPLTTAVERNPDLYGTVVCDERSAAFIALGMSIQSGRPVAVICTSGTAVLDLAPAVAEAYYRRVPLIVISADRPADMIDAGHPQTIRQPGALANIVKVSVDIDSAGDTERAEAFANRLMNQALDTAMADAYGPVHINIHIESPASTGDPAVMPLPRKIDVIRPVPQLSTAAARKIGELISPPAKVMILAGFMSPDTKINRAIGRLAAIPNIAVLAEETSNIHHPDVIFNIDAVLASMPAGLAGDLLPDVVITLGGSLVSSRMAKWLADSNVRHWSVDDSPYLQDTFGRLERRFAMPARSFLPQLASAMQPYSASDSDYGESWRKIAEEVKIKTKKYANNALWSDFRAVHEALAMLPAGWNVHLSNGMSVRIAETADCSHIHRIECNRGVSGIDGSTSTAIGSALVTDTPTLLITGDMSAQYDMGALAFPDIPPTFRMVVLSNGGGNIFRVVKSTCNLPERERCFACDVNLPLRELAGAFGFDYYESADAESFIGQFPGFIKQSGRPAIFNVIVDGPLSADVYTEYFKTLKK